MNRRIVNIIGAVALGLAAVLNGDAASATHPQRAVGCAAAEPSPAAGHRWDLLNTRAGSYRGKPFQFVLTIRHSPEVPLQQYVFKLKPKSYRTGTLRGVAVKVEAWYGTQQCRTWTGSVRSHA